jgi:hypothetical protein
LTELNCDVFAKSGATSLEQYVTMRLAKVDSSNIPMSLRNPPPECSIDLSICQKKLLKHATTKLTTTLDAVPIDNKAVHLAGSSDNEAVDLAASSDKSEPSSKLDAKYETNMRSLGHLLCNWWFEKCHLPNYLPMHCQFKNGCNKFAHTRCSVLWSRTHGWNVHDL